MLSSIISHDLQAFLFVSTILMKLINKLINNIMYIYIYIYILTIILNTIVHIKYLWQDNRIHPGDSLCLEYE